MSSLPARDLSATPTVSSPPPDSASTAKIRRRLARLLALGAVRAATVRAAAPEDPSLASPPSPNQTGGPDVP